jgi:putative hydrolase of the HAD superfamily
MADSTITTVTFDAGNTLLYCDPSPAEIYAGALGRHGRSVSADDVEPVFASSWAQLQERTPPGIDRYGSQPGGEKMWWGAFLREVLERLDHDADWRALLDDLYDAFSRPEVWRAYPETHGTLSAVRGLGHQTAVISNWDRRLPAILDSLELSSLFDTITVSAIEGIEKPAPEIFTRTLERLGVPAAVCVHIGDSPIEDYRGAERVGMTPILIDRSGRFAMNGFRRISSLDGVLELLR